MNITLIINYILLNKTINPQPMFQTMTKLVFLSLVLIIYRSLLYFEGLAPDLCHSISYMRSNVEGRFSAKQKAGLAAQIHGKWIRNYRRVLQVGVIYAFRLNFNLYTMSISYNDTNQPDPVVLLTIQTFDPTIRLHSPVSGVFLGHCNESSL